MHFATGCNAIAIDPASRTITLPEDGKAVLPRATEGVEPYTYKTEGLPPYLQVDDDGNITIKADTPIPAGDCTSFIYCVTDAEGVQTSNYIRVDVQPTE